MNELALFAGAGGGLLGSRLLGWRTICYVEKERYCVKILKARIKDGYLDDAPIWDDARTFDGRPWAGLVDVITAGFPCQPFSGAGKKLGADDKRNLWPDTIRIIREIRPRWVLLENVSRLLSIDYFGRILGDLAKSGYSAQWNCISAASVGAPHRRDRVWIVANSLCDRRRNIKYTRGILSYQNWKVCGTKQNGSNRITRFSTDSCIESMANSNGGGLQAGTQFNSTTQEHSSDWCSLGEHASGCSDVMANADSQEQQLHKQEQQREIRKWSNIGGEGSISGTWWKVEPQLGRVVDGMANRVDRLRAIGNGQVPAVVRAAWMLLSE